MNFRFLCLHAAAIRELELEKYSTAPAVYCCSEFSYEELGYCWGQNLKRFEIEWDFEVCE